MRPSWLWLVLVVGCKTKDVDTGGTSAAEVIPTSCVADDEVCTSFSAEWTQEDADAFCAELGGTAGECPEEEMGACELENGLAYHLYALAPQDAKNYCEWLGGEWVEPGDEAEEED